MPTAKAFSLVQLLRGLGVAELARPEMTGDWEAKLKKMERAELARDVFMEDIRSFTAEIVRKAKLYDKDTIPGDFGKLTVPCPRCGAEVHEKFRDFKCTACAFSVRKVLSGRMFEPAEVEQLIRDKQLGPLQGFRSKIGRPFAALLKLSPEFEVKFDFGDEGKEGEGGAESAPDFTGKEPVGNCPKCQSRVFENGVNYVCEKAVGPAKTCDFRCGAVILMQTVDRAQISKLLSTGKTDVLKGFVSRKTNRKFEAFLVVKDGKVSFEFPPREKKAGGKKGASAEPEQKFDFAGQTSMGACPKCGGAIYVGGENYLCEKTQAEGKKCTFKVGRTILGQAVNPEQFGKMLANGRTDLLKDFVSRSGKQFQAHLVMGDKGKVEFEFPQE